MKIELDLSAVPVPCWWWTGLVVYLLISWLVVGPYFSRRVWKSWYREFTFETWLFAPFHWPFSVLILGLRRVFLTGPMKNLIYGRDA